jgi:hypothetical protein
MVSANLLLIKKYLVQKGSRFGIAEHQCSLFEYLKTVLLGFKKSYNLLHEYTHMSWILVQSFGRNCVVLWAIGKKNGCE